MYFKNFVLCALSLGYVASLPSPSLDPTIPPSVGQQGPSNSIDAKQDFFENVYADCADKGSVPCFKYKLFAFVDKIANKDEINLANGITVVRTAVMGDGAPRALPLDKEAQIESKVDLTTGLMKRVEKFLKTHTLKVDLRGTDVLNAVSRAGRTLDELSEDLTDVSSDGVELGRGKKKKASKILMPLLMMLKMKMLGLIPLAFGAIALIAGKALLVGKIALLLSGIILLKKLLSHQKTVTYEIVQHPHHASSGGHLDSYAPSVSDYGTSAGGYGGSSHGGWGRSADAAQDMAYSAQKPHAS